MLGPCGLICSLNAHQKSVADTVGFEPDSCCNNCMKACCCAPCYTCQIWREIKTSGKYDFDEENKGCCSCCGGAKEGGGNGGGKKGGGTADEDDGTLVVVLEDLEFKKIGTEDLDELFDGAKDIIDQLKEIDALLQEPFEKIGTPTGAWVVGAEAHSATKIFRMMLTSLVCDQEGNCAFDDLKQFIPKVDYSALITGDVTVEVAEFDKSKIVPEFQACLDAFKELIQNIIRICGKMLVPLGQAITDFVALVIEKAADFEAVGAKLQEDFSSNPFAIPGALMAVKHNVPECRKLPTIMADTIKNISHILKGLQDGFKQGIEEVESRKAEIAQKALDAAKDVVVEEAGSAAGGVVGAGLGDTAGEVAQQAAETAAEVVVEMTAEEL